MKKSDTKGAMLEMLLYSFVKGSKVEKFITKGSITEFMSFLPRVTVIPVITMIRSIAPITLETFD